MKKVGKNYNVVKSQIRPFDLILFRGDDFVSNTIRRLQKHQLGKGADAFSHCGVIVTTDILSHPNMEPGKLYIFESTMGGRLGQGVKNINGKTWLGSQIRDFDAVMVGYDASPDTRIAWLKIKKNPLDTHPINEVREKMAYLFGKYNNKLYEIHIINLFRAMFPSCRRRQFLRKQFLFCSELAALIYKKFNVLPKDCDPSNVVPADFIVQDNDHKVDYLKWGPMVYITVNHK